MASIIKRSNKYAVVYGFIDRDGNRKQKWETFDTRKMALKRKAEVESQIENSTYSPPAMQTVSAFLKEFVEVYGANKWSMSTYSAREGIIRNYVEPFIGSVPLSELNTRMMDQYYQTLLRQSAAPRPGRDPEPVTPRTVIEVHRILRCAFNQAIRWEYISKNPAEHATLPKHEAEKREIWTADEVICALEHCDDPILRICIHLAFACSMRIGEILGLTWDCVTADEQNIVKGNASVYIEKELSRVRRTAVTQMNGNDILKVIPPLIPGSGATMLVLKTPKTHSSVRRVWLPETVARLLVKHKGEQDKVKKLMGDYQDYGLVVAQDNGRPYEEHVIRKGFTRLIKKSGLPTVVFHSLRHTSTTYKLKLNNGDIKSVQGDTGHSQINMVTDVYSHIIDGDRRQNAQRFEQSFYKPKKGKKGSTPDVSKLAEALSENPELAQMLLGLLSKKGSNFD